MPNTSRTLCSFTILALAHAATAAAAPPKTLWELDFDGHDYTLHAHGSIGTPTSFDDTKTAIDARVQKGEWIVYGLLGESPPENERTVLVARAAKRGAVFTRGDVVRGQIPGVKRSYRTGRPRNVTVALTNESPYRIAVTTLVFGGCGIHAEHALPKPIVLAPKGRTKTRVDIDPKSITSRDAIPANCMPNDGWSSIVGPKFDVL